MTVRVVIAQDDLLLRAGLAQVLEQHGFVVCATAADAPGLIDAVAEHRPDLVLTDIHLPPDRRDGGLRAAIALRRDDPGPAVVVLSRFADPGPAAMLLGASPGGRVGYLVSGRLSDLDEFVGSLRAVAGGGTVIDPEVTRRVLRHRHDPLSRLTRREREVLALVADGHSNSAISRRLHITETVVSKHIGNVLDKLDLPPTGDTNRRVMAVLAFLRSNAPAC